MNKDVTLGFYEDPFMFLLIHIYCLQFKTTTYGRSGQQALTVTAYMLYCQGQKSPKKAI